MTTASSFRSTAALLSVPPVSPSCPSTVLIPVSSGRLCLHCRARSAALHLGVSQFSAFDVNPTCELSKSNSRVHGWALLVQPANDETPRRRRPGRQNGTHPPPGG